MQQAPELVLLCGDAVDANKDVMQKAYKMLPLRHTLCIAYWWCQLQKRTSAQSRWHGACHRGGAVLGLEDGSRESALSHVQIDI